MNTSDSDSAPPQGPGLHIQGATPKRHFGMLWVVLSIAALAAASATLVALNQVSSPSPTPPTSPTATIEATQKPAPVVTWSENPLEVILSPGETASRTLTLTSDRKVGKLRLCVSSTLAPFLTINVLDKHDLDDDVEDHALGPVDDVDDALLDKKGCTRERVKLNPRKAPQAIKLTFTIPTGTTFGTYEGTVEIWRGKRMLSQILRMSANVWQGLTNGDLGLSLKYPPVWKLSDFDGDVDLRVLEFVTIDPPMTDPRYGGDVKLFVWSNPSSLPIEEFFDGAPGQNLLADATAGMTVFKIAGKRAVRFRDVIGIATVDVVVVDAGQAMLEFHVWRNDALFEQMLSSLQFL